MRNRQILVNQIIKSSKQHSSKVMPKSSSPCSLFVKVWSIKRKGLK